MIFLRGTGRVDLQQALTKECKLTENIFCSWRGYNKSDTKEASANIPNTWDQFTTVL